MCLAQGGNSLTGTLPAVATSSSLLMLNLDYNQFTGGWPADPETSTLLVSDISNNLLSGSLVDPVALTDYDIRFAPLDAALGASFAFYADNNNLTGTFPQYLLPHTEVRLQALMLVLCNRYMSTFC